MSTGFSFSGFGQSSSTSASQPTSLFGAPKPAATQSLFGAPSSSAPSTSNAPLGSSLFGSTASTAPKPSFNFGTSSTATNTLTPGVSGLFGGTSSSSNNLTSAPSGGLFGGNQSQPANSFLGSLGASNPTSLNNASSVSGPSFTPAITKATKFNDLPEAARNAVEAIDTFIRNQVATSNELKRRHLGEDISHTKYLYEQYAAEASAVSNLLAQDARATNELRSKIEADLDDVTKATAIIEGYKNPQVKGSAAKAAANFPYEFFSRKAEEFQERISRYRSTMDQIQEQVESAHRLDRNPAAIVPTLKAQHTSFMALASAVAALDLQLKQLKEQYRQVWREKTGSALDPFKAVKAREGLERGVEHIAIR